MPDPIIIKKYANRRLYNTETSVYVTLEDLGQMVKRGEDFTVVDAKTGEDLTRSVLGQIIFEMENSGGENMLPIPFLRQLIRFYGDSMQALVPGYLDMALQNFTKQQDTWRTNMSGAFGAPFSLYEDQMKQNMKMFEQAFSMFTPFAKPQSEPARDNDVEAMTAKMGQMQAEIDALKKPR